MRALLIQTIRSIAQKLYKRYKGKAAPPSPSSRYEAPQSDPPTPKPVVPDPSISVDISETPNPQACKYDVSVQVSEKSFSFSKSNMPVEHALANELLSIDGVESVFGVHTFITATKSAEAEWDTIHPKITTVLQKNLS